MWSDPEPCVEGWQPEFNDTRGAGVFYGPDMVSEWLDKVQCPMMVRSHELRNDKSWDVMECPHDKKCCTVFSVSNYYEVGSNTASVLTILIEGGQSTSEVRTWMTKVDDDNDRHHAVQRNSAQMFEQQPLVQKIKEKSIENPSQIDRKPSKNQNTSYLQK